MGKNLVSLLSMAFVRFLLYFFLIAIVYLSDAQPLAFQKITVHEGLSQNTVIDIQFDRQGFLWAATGDGLNRFDGYEFKQYRNSGPKEGRLMNIGINSILCDWEGKVWIAGNKGLEVLDPITNKATTLALFTATFGDAKWFEDDQHVYVFLKDRGVWVFNPQSLERKMFPFSEYPSFAKDMSMVSILESEDKQALYIFPRSRSYFYTWNKQSEKIQKQNFSTTDQIYLASSVCQFTPTSVLLAAVVNNQMELIEYHPAKRKALRQQKINMLNQDPFYKAVLFAPELNRIIVSDVNRGLVFFDYDFHEVNNYPSTTILSDHSENIIFHGALVKNNCLWIGTDPNGIVYANLANVPFYHFKNNQNRTTSVVKGIFTDREENVYSALLYEGVQVFDKQGNYLHNLEPIGAGSQPLRLHAFNTFLPVGMDSVFIFCQNFLGFYNTRTRQYKNFIDAFYQLSPDNQERYGMCQAAIIAPGKVIIASLHNVWIANLAGNRAEFKLIQTFSDPISAICSMDNKEFMIGTTAGLYKMRETKPIAATGASFIKHIHHDHRGNFWVSTTEGLWQLDKNLNKLHYFSTENGLANNFIYGSLESNDKLWLSTNMGLSSINLSTFKITNYSEEDGLQSNEFNSGALWRSNDGKLYFGGINGINLINENFENAFSAKFNIAITQIRLNDSVTLDSHHQQFELKHGQNTLAFTFAGLLPSYGQYIHYRYQLHGFDKDWVQANKMRTARYPNLPSGEYTFRVAASLGHKEFNNESKPVTIMIMTPWWQSWWFYVLLIIATVILFVTIIRWINKKKAAKKQAVILLEQQLEAERQRISRDLHDNIGSYASALLANVQQLKSANEERSTRELEKIQSNATKILGSLRETIWVLSHRSISVLELADNFKAHCIRLLDNYPDIQFEATESVSLNKILPAGKAFHLNKILQEALENTVKHASATKLTFTVTCNSELTITLIDNGKGFDLKQPSSGHGTHNMDWRAKEAGFSLQVTSMMRVGTTVVLKEGYSLASIEKQ